MNSYSVTYVSLFLISSCYFFLVWWLEKKEWVGWFRGLLVLVGVAYTLTVSGLTGLIDNDTALRMGAAFFFALLPLLILDLAWHLQKLDEVGRFFEKLEQDTRKELDRRKGDNS